MGLRPATAQHRPFVLKEWQVGDHMTFEKNPNYYEAGKPGIDKVVIKIVPDDTVRKEMLLKGDSDLIMWVSETIAKELDGKPDVAVSVSPTNRWVLRIYMNEAARGTTDPVASPNPFFADVRVRKAVRQAVDVDTIANSVFYGFSSPAWTEFHREPYKCEIPRPKYDPEAAKALLEEAGWKDTDGDGVRECHGCANANEGDLLEFELATYPDYGEPILALPTTHRRTTVSDRDETQLVVIEGKCDVGGSREAAAPSRAATTTWTCGTTATPASTRPITWTKSTTRPRLCREAVGISPAGSARRWTSFWPNRTRWMKPNARKSSVRWRSCSMSRFRLPCSFTIINADAHSARLQGIHSNGNDVVTWNAADWTVK